MKIDTPVGVVNVDERPLVNGKRITTKETMGVINPATGNAFAKFNVCSDKEVVDAVSSAKKAFKKWGGLSLEERLSYIDKLKKEILKEYDDLVALETMETGKPLMYSDLGPVFLLLTLDYYKSRAKEFLAEKEIKTPAIANMIFLPRKNYRVFTPKGVIGVIVPWNFPVVLAAGSIIPALIAGNTVVYKPSSRTPFTGSKMAEIFNRVLPPGTFNLLQGKGSIVGDKLVKSDVDMVVFTGSTRVGAIVAENCGRNLVPCTLELGGLDPMVVLEDADLEEASSGAVYGSFLNTGQICIAAKRVLVHKGIYGRFLSLVKQKARKLRIGDGFSPDSDIGPLISQKQLEKVERFVQDAIRKGAKVELGGKRIKREGFFFEPTILTKITKDMLVCCEEPFGPIMPVIPFSDDEEAIEIANSTEYGLAGSVWSKDTKKAKEIAKRIVTGTIWVNDVALPFVHAPFGGVRKSGMLKEMAREGIRDLCHRKVISVPIIHTKTRQWWFPVDINTRFIMKDFAEFIARRRLTRKTKVLAKMIRDFIKYGRMG